MIIAIGNGESRKNIDLNSIATKKIGCNAIYRDFDVDHLICVDKRMVLEALESNANNNSLIYTRKDLFTRFPTKRIRQVPPLPYASYESADVPKNWGSGPYAVLLSAIKTDDDSVGLLGFDLYGIDDKTNNIYKDTTNYNVSDKKAINPSYWIHQIGMVFKCFPNVQFTIYQEQGWQKPKAWKQPNVTVDTISNL